MDIDIIQTEIEDPILDPALEELKECLVRERVEKEKKARREKWRRILGLGFFSKKKPFLLVTRVIKKQPK